MKKTATLILALLICSSAFGSAATTHVKAAAKPTAPPSGEQSVNVGSSAILHCRAMQVCYIKPPPGEAVTGKEVGQSLYWEFIDKPYGDRQQNSILFIRTRVEDDGTSVIPSTNVIVTTNGKGGLYQVYVVFDRNAPVPSGITFQYPKPKPTIPSMDETNVDPAELAAQRQQVAIASAEARVCATHVASPRYTIQGPHTDFWPIDVFSDGSHVCIVEPDQVGTVTPGPIVEVGADIGHWRFVNSVFRIDGTPPVVELSDGNQTIRIVRQ